LTAISRIESTDELSHREQLLAFLLTNDDGIDAPGLAALRQAIEPLGQGVVLAPDRHLSGCSHQATTSRPLELTEVAINCYALDGSPVDCTRIGLGRIAPETRWVLAGVNEGGNLGADVYQSGTVAAAREACLLGKAAVAISQYIRRRPIDWQQTALWTRHVIELLLPREPPAGSFWNVNLPQSDEPAAGVPECVFCQIDPHPLPIDYDLRDGKLHYKGRYQDRQRAAGRDVALCFSGHITISQIDLHSASSMVANSPQGSRR
jgi:5'-nucleotidase